MNVIYVISGRTVLFSTVKKNRGWKLELTVIVNLNRNLFRPQYGRLGVLRVLFPEVPIMALSATLSHHVLLYTQSVLRLNKPTGIVKRSINRQNILLYCIPITHSINSRQDLLFLIPLDIVFGAVRQLPKTMVFMDSRQAVCDMTTTLLARLPPEYRNADIVCDYSTALSESRRHDVMAKFITGECRILICTEAAGMGIDVADVVRVIQWTIPRQLNLASFWQRAGRGGRNRQLQSLAILFYKKAQCIPKGVDHPLKLFCLPPESPEAFLVLKAIRAFDVGAQTSKKQGAIDCELPVAAVVEKPPDETGLHGNTVQSNTPLQPTDLENIDPLAETHIGYQGMQHEPHLSTDVGPIIHLPDPISAGSQEGFDAGAHFPDS